MRTLLHTGYAALLWAATWPSHAFTWQGLTIGMPASEFTQKFQQAARLDERHYWLELTLNGDTHLLKVSINNQGIVDGVDSFTTAVSTPPPIDAGAKEALTVPAAAPTSAEESTDFVSKYREQIAKELGEPYQSSGDQGSWIWLNAQEGVSVELRSLLGGIARVTVQATPAP